MRWATQSGKRYHVKTFTNGNGRVEACRKPVAQADFEVIRRDGLEELGRPKLSLMWSGIAAGIMISLSVLGEAVFRTYLPDAQWSYLVENLGYSLGFLVVILGRMQLFTENTITTVLPVMQDPCAAMFRRLATLWGIVLTANVVGAFVAAFMFAHTSAIPAELLPAITELSLHATGFPLLRRSNVQSQRACWSPQSCGCCRNLMGLGSL